MKKTNEVIPINVMDPIKIEPVAAYIRVSSDEQKIHGISLQAQEQKLQEYAEANNMKIVEWYRDEGVSGRKLISKRPELQRMIHDAEKGLFERIIFIKLDRFFRSVAEYHECMKKISPVIWTATEEKYDLSNAQGRMLVNMKLTIAELEADQTGERINLVNEYKVSVGQWLSGSAPFGYKVAKNDINRAVLVKDPDTEEMAEDLIRHYMTHQNKRKAVIYLKEKYDFKWYSQHVDAWLKNPIIYGHYRGKDNFCEPYVDKKTFDRIQDMLGRSVRQNTAPLRVYIFGGLIRCPVCGALMSGGTYTKLRKGKRVKYKYYRCPNHVANKSCTFPKSISENVLHQKIFERIDDMVNEAKVKQIEAQERASKKNKVSIESINAEIDRLNYSWQKGMIRTVELYEEQYRKLLQRLDDAKTERHDTVDFSRIEMLLGNGWKDVYNALDDDHRKAFWRQFISSINIDHNKEITNINFF